MSGVILECCPFCGEKIGDVEEHIIRDVIFYRIRCENISCLMQPKTEWNKDRAIVIKRWNSRPVIS